MQTRETCALCGLTVEIEGFALASPANLQKFCCEGCLSIFQLLRNVHHDLDSNIELSLTNQP